MKANIEHQYWKTFLFLTSLLTITKDTKEITFFVVSLHSVISNYIMSSINYLLSIFFCMNRVRSKHLLLKWTLIYQILKKLQLSKNKCAFFHIFRSKLWAEMFGSEIPTTPTKNFEQKIFQILHAFHQAKKQYLEVRKSKNRKMSQ